MRKVLLLCLALGALAAVRGEDALGCPPGLFGDGCNTCYNDHACVVLTKSEGAWCFNTTMFQPETKKKSYACETEGTKWEDTISHVWADCAVEVQKCDVHFALGGYPLTCSGLTCSFQNNGWSCDYVKCQCDGTCPTVNGVSLGYMLDKLQTKARMSCEESWGPPSKCTIEVDGLSDQKGGFEAYCASAECREW